MKLRIFITTGLSFIAGAAVVAVIAVLFGIGMLTALVDESEIRARNSLLHQIGDYKPRPDECLIVDERAICIVKFARGRELVEFNVTKTPKP